MTIEVTFHNPLDNETTIDYFDGTVGELIVDLLTDEWPYTFFTKVDDRVTFQRINTNDLVSFNLK